MTEKEIRLRTKNLLKMLISLAGAVLMLRWLPEALARESERGAAGTVLTISYSLLFMFFLVWLAYEISAYFRLLQVDKERLG